MLAMGVNDDAFCLLANVSLECIVGTPPGAGSLLQKRVGCFSEGQKRKNPLSRVSVKFKVLTLNLNWCPEEDSNFHDLAVTST